MHIFRGLFALGLILFLSISPRSAAGALIAHWRLDEGAGFTVNDEVGTFDGTIHTIGGVAGAGWLPAPDGACAGALCLDVNPSGYVDMGNVLGLTGNFSIILWLRVAPNEARWLIPLSKHLSQTNNGYFIGINEQPNGLGAPCTAYFYMSDCCGGTELVASSCITDGQWHQIAVSYNASGSVAIYVDGGPAENSRPIHAIVQNTAKFILGGICGSTGSPEPFYAGFLDDVRIYNHALSGAEVQANYDAITQCQAPGVYEVPPQCVIAGTGIADPEVIPPAGLGHVYNWPNPFHAFTEIHFDAPVGQSVTVDIYDLRGAHVARVHDGIGGKVAVWDGRDHDGQRVTPGVYFSQVQAGGQAIGRKLVVLSGP
jgi:hypothetical protein